MRTEILQILGYTHIIKLVLMGTVIFVALNSAPFFLGRLYFYIEARKGRPLQLLREWRPHQW